MVARMLENCVMHQKKSFQVLFPVIARVLFWIFCDESKHILFGSDVCSKITRLLFSTWCSVISRNVAVISASHIPCYTFIIVTSVSDVCIWEIPCVNLPHIPCYTFIIAVNDVYIQENLCVTLSNIPCYTFIIVVNDVYIWEIPCVTLARRTKVGHGYSSMCHLVTFHVTSPL